MGSLSAALDGGNQRAARAITGGVRAATSQLNNSWRAIVVGAGLSRRIANAIRSKNYPASGVSLDPAGVVYASRGTPENLLYELDHGTVIRSKKGFFLSIPTKDVPPGARGKKPTPASFEAQTGIKLRFVFTHRNFGLLVGDNAQSHSGRGVRAPTKRRTRQGRAVQSTVFFILVAQATMRKRFDLEKEATRIEANLPALIAERMT